MSDYQVALRGDPPVAVLALTGRIDSEAMGALTDAYEQAVQGDATIVLLDFSEVSYINSTGIALIVGILGRARAEQRKVFASGLTDHYTHIFNITRLSDFINIYEDVATAVTAASDN